MSSPAFAISSGGLDLTGNFNDRLISLEVSDAEGFASDSVTITLDDRDGAIAIPPKGKVLNVSLGYRETGLIPMGQFTVDEVEVSGWPQQMTIRARAADLRDTLKQHRTGYWDEKSLSDILSEVAQRNGLSAAVGQELSSFEYKYLPQTEESDLHLITRLAKQHDAIAKVAGGKLLFSKKGTGMSAGGVHLGGATITRTMMLDYTAQLKDRPAHKETRATWWDRKKVERVVEKGNSKTATDQAVDAIFGYRHSLPTKEEAEARAQSQQDELDRAAATLNVTIIGNPNIGAEMVISVVGVRAGVDGQWRVKTATHNLDSSGYVTSLSCEIPGASGSDSGSSGSESGSSGGSGGGTSGSASTASGGASAGDLEPISVTPRDGFTG